MSICSNEVFTVSTSYDCVRMCDRPVFAAPVVEYEIDDFKLTAKALQFNGVLRYKWIIKDNGFTIYDSGYGLVGTALPLIGNASTHEEFLFGNDYADLKTMLNQIAPYYASSELKFEIQANDDSEKESEIFSSFFLTLL